MILMVQRGEIRSIADPDDGTVRLMVLMGWHRNAEEWEDVETGKILLLNRAQRRSLVR